MISPVAAEMENVEITYSILMYRLGTYYRKNQHQVLNIRRFKNIMNE